MATSAAAADRVGITVTGPSQQLTVTKQSSTITPQTVTVNAQINQVGTEIITVAVPGPQGPPFHPFIASPTPPANTNVFWVDPTDVTAPLLYVYLEGSWRQIAGGGATPSSNPTYNDNSNISFNDGVLLTL